MNTPSTNKKVLRTTQVTYKGKLYFLGSYAGDGHYWLFDSCGYMLVLGKDIEPRRI